MTDIDNGHNDTRVEIDHRAAEQQNTHVEIDHGHGELGTLAPDSITLCARCGYDAWRDNYPCNRCGGLEPRRYVPVDAVVGALQREGEARGWMPEAFRMAANYVERRFGSA